MLNQKKLIYKKFTMQILNVTEDWHSQPQNLIDYKWSSTSDVTVLGGGVEGGRGLYNDSTKISVIKSVMMEGGGQKMFNLCSAIYEQPLTGVFAIWTYPSELTYFFERQVRYDLDK